MKKMQWYVIQATTNMENKVVTALKDKIAQKNMTEYFGEILFPQEEVVTHVNGKKKIQKKKIFPGYILVQMIAEPSALLLVKDIPKVIKFISHNQSQPLPISDEEAENMLKRQKEGFHSVANDLSVGDEIKVVNGPFATFKGVVEHSDGDKLKVTVTIFGRPTSLELKRGDIVKAVEK